MKKIKALFAKPKTAVLAAVCILAAICVLCAGGTYAFSAIAESSAIGEENAKYFAFADAGVDPTAAEQVEVSFSREQGQFVYEVEFVADNTEYEYWIRATDGAVVKRELEITAQKDGQTSTITAALTADDAVELALADAGVTADDATVTEKTLDMEDGISVYDIDFYTADAEYEYEIDATSGAVLTKSVKAAAQTENSGNAQAESSGNAQTESSSSNVPNESGNAQTESSSSNAPNESGNSQAESSSSNTQNESGNSQAESGQISLVDAKKIALDDAGVSESSVTYTKAKLDREDGVAVYEIEFYTSSHEYEYEINAATGAIRDKDVEARSDGSANSSNNSNSSSSCIGTDKAKSIAAGHAGFSVSDVTFSKVKLDREDGQMVYEVEFYFGGTEYEYTIQADTGSILEYDSEREDDD